MTRRSRSILGWLTPVRAIALVVVFAALIFGARLLRPFYVDPFPGLRREYEELALGGSFHLLGEDEIPSALFAGTDARLVRVYEYPGAPPEVCQIIRERLILYGVSNIGERVNPAALTAGTGKPAGEAYLWYRPYCDLFGPNSDARGAVDKGVHVKAGVYLLERSVPTSVVLESARPHELESGAIIRIVLTD